MSSKVATKRGKSAKNAPTAPTTGLLDVAGAAAHLKISEKSVRKRVQERSIPFIKVGALLRFKRERLDAYLDENSFGPEGG